MFFSRIRTTSQIRYSRGRGAHAYVGNEYEATQVGATAIGPQHRVRHGIGK